MTDSASHLPDPGEPHRLEDLLSEDVRRVVQRKLNRLAADRFESEKAAAHITF